MGENIGMADSGAMSQHVGSQLPAYLMAIFLIGSGAGHFAAPERFDEAMPKELPGDVRTYTLGSGVVEVVIGALLLLRRTRHVGAWATVAFFIVITPAIANGVRLASGKGALPMLVAVARLPLQVFLIAQAIKIRRNV